jgi:two-component system, NtrC family, sensor kinase
LERAIDILTDQKNKQSTTQRQHLDAYIGGLAKIMAIISPEKIITLDYEALDQMAETARTDPNIVFINLNDPDGNNLTNQEKKKCDYVITEKIYFDQDEIGIIEIGVSLAGLKASVKELESATSKLIVLEKNKQKKAAKSLLTVAFFFTLITCTFSIAIIIISVRIIIKRLFLLLTGIQYIRSGDFSHELIIPGKDEISEVATIFNLMRLKLQAMLQEITEYQELLEEKVILRTMELKEKNNELINTNHELQQAMSTIRETQEELLKVEKFAVAGQMSGIVAHEVLNPITTIILRVELNIKRATKSLMIYDKLDKITTRLSNQLKTGELVKEQKDLQLINKINTAMKKNQEERFDDFQFLHKQLNRVVKIVDGLRQMSKTKKHIEPIDLSKLIIDLVDDMTDGLKKRKIKVNLDLSEVPIIQADNMEMYSIFSNLIRNGIQAIEKQTEIREKLINITLRTTKNEFMEILVTDTGIGVQEERLENIFEPGFTNKGREGTGLGLSFSRKVARSYSGDLILLESEFGKGSTFQVSLPVNTPCHSQVNDKE